MMFTRCPECQTTQPITLEQLRDSRGMLQCQQCSALFDALALISETEAIAAEQNIPDSGLPWSKEKPTKPVYWSLGACLCLLLLAVQIVYFEGHAYTQNPKTRPFLAVLCERIACRLPHYKNSDEFNLVGSFIPTPDHHYEFHAAISNQAAFPQAYPNIKLTLLNFNGKPFAARTFRPQDYLPEISRTSVIKPDETTEISLKIASPKSKIGGSSFELID